MDEAGNCTNPDVARFLDTHGEELGAALAALRKRPDVDPSLALGVGISIGGASMLDLAARPDHPLAAVINISGGVYHYSTMGSPEADCSLYQADLVRNFTTFGTNNPTPTLWMYAENDPYFSPDQLHGWLLAIARRVVTQIMWRCHRLVRMVIHFIKMGPINC